MIIQKSKIKALLVGSGLACMTTIYALALFSFNGYAAYVLSHPDARHKANLIENLVNMICLYSFVFVGFGGILLLGLIVRFVLMKEPGLKIDYEGISFWQYLTKVERISWCEIDRIENTQGSIGRIFFGLVSPDFFSFVTIFVKPIPGKRCINKLNRMLGMGEYVIDHRYLRSSAKEILALAKHYRSGKPQNIVTYPRENLV